MTFIDYEVMAKQRLGEAGFYRQSLSDLELPEVRFKNFGLEGDYARFSLPTNLWSAEEVVLAPITYSTHLDDTSNQVRLAAQQTVLGDTFAVVGVEVYDPRQAKLTAEQRKAVTGGSFELFSGRLLRLLEYLNLGADQRVSLFGYSFGADVAVQAIHDTLHNPQRGFRSIERLGAYECARMMERGRLAMTLAFNKSGAGLWNNVLESRSPALLEARGINPMAVKAEKQHADKVKNDVLAYGKADVRGAWAMSAGLGTSASKDQLINITQDCHMPDTTVARMDRSTITAPDFRDGLLPSQRLRTPIYLDKDHSAIDNLNYSAAFMLETVRAA